MNENYTEARKAGNKEVKRAIYNGHYPYVSALEYHKEDYLVCAKKDIGLCEIPVDLIAGTLTQSRAQMFSPGFLPIAEEGSEFAYKWATVYNYQIDKGISDPIKVYEFRHLFYVVEGNKRVSVTRYMDISHISAEVTRIEDKDDDGSYARFVSFFDCTGTYDLFFSKPESYELLARQLNRNLQDKWPKEAVRSLIAAFSRFRTFFKKKTKNKDYVLCCDAFLIYIEVYGLERLKSVSEKELESDYLKIQKEVDALYDKDHIALSDKPQSDSWDPLRNIRKMIPLMDNGTRIAFIYESDPLRSAAVYNHELGRLLLDERNEDIHTCCYTDGDGKTIEKAAESADVVFTTSPLLYEDTYRSAIKHPNVRFYNCSLYQSHAALKTYDIRMYEAKFLLGALSAMLTENHFLGYIADVPTYGTIADINAFAIGASMIDANVKVYLGWKETLDQDWQNQMRYLNIQVFSGPAMADFVDYSPEYGIYQLSDNDVLNLAAPLVNWDVYYEKLLKNTDKENRQGKAINEWWGMREGVLDISLSSSLPYTSRKMITALKNGLINSAIRPFAGELHSQEKVIKQAGEELSIAEIVTMNWLNENIIGIIPEYQELTAIGKAFSEISGVKKK